MRVYLVTYDVYEDLYGELMREESLYNSVVFTDFEMALTFAKTDIENWLERHKPDSEYISGSIKIMERDTEDEDVNIEWYYDLHGNLCERLVWDMCGYDVRPGDEKPEAGTKFKIGDIVELKQSCNNMKSNIYVVAGTPFKREPPQLWENYYIIDGIDQGNGYWHHEHAHESEIKHYSGKLPDGYALLSKLYKKEINISLRRLKEIFGKTLTANKYAQGEIASKNLNDDSTDTAELLLLMLYENALDIREKVIPWRKAEKRCAFMYKHGREKL